MPDPKSAEELALAAFRWERDAARDWQRYARTAARRAKSAESPAALLTMCASSASWQQVASLHRRNVSTLARIIRALREERRLSRCGESEHYTSRGEVNGG